MTILDVRHIQKTFDRTPVLKDISFSLEQGQVLSIIGSSGSGKTTLLRCLNFLEQPDQGSICVNDEVLFDASDPATQRESEIRKKRLHFGLVFQSFNLFPQYTAKENIMLAKELLAIPISSPAVSSSGWPSPGLWPCSRTFYALTSPPPPWIRSSPGRCCGS